MGFRDRFGKPSGGVRVKTLRVDSDFLLRKKWPQMRLLFVFERFQGLNHWGLLGSRVGYVRLTREACFDVRAKTRVVQICQVRRQVHPGDVFDGGLFVILGWTEQKCFKHGSLHVYNSRGPER